MICLCLLADLLRAKLGAVTEKRKQIITEKVFEILHNNRLSREDIKLLFKLDSLDDSDDRVIRAAEEITALFIAEE